MVIFQLALIIFVVIISLLESVNHFFCSDIVAPYLLVLYVIYSF